MTPNEARGLALFDFDGTITSNDTWTPFIRSAIRPERMRFGKVLLAPVVAAYRLGLISASRGREMAVRVGLRHEPLDRIQELGARYAASVLPTTVRPLALERLEWHKAQGHDVVVVSASLGCYLRPWCDAHALSVICTELEERHGRLTGRYVEGDCAGREKVRRLRRHVDMNAYGVIYAYGDTREDRELLELAHRKFYRWNEITSWDDVTALEHPDPAGQGDGR